MGPNARYVKYEAEANDGNDISHEIAVGVTNKRLRPGFYWIRINNGDMYRNRRYFPLMEGAFVKKIGRIYPVVVVLKIVSRIRKSVMMVQGEECNSRYAGHMGKNQGLDNKNAGYPIP
eukprot:1349452-Amorphochlora_amoeboformis.AAC.3